MSGSHTKNHTTGTRTECGHRTGVVASRWIVPRLQNALLDEATYQQRHVWQMINIPRVLICLVGSLEGNLEHQKATPEIAPVAHLRTCVVSRHVQNRRVFHGPNDG